MSGPTSGIATTLLGCTNCEECNVQCVNEFEKAAHKSRKAELSIEDYQALDIKLDSHAISSVRGQENSIVDPRPPPRVLCFSLYFPALSYPPSVLDPTEFSRRYCEAIQGNPGSLGRVGKLISKILVAWAASHGVDESGRELVTSSGILQDPLIAPPDLGTQSIRCAENCPAGMECVPYCYWCPSLKILYHLRIEWYEALHQSALNQLYTLTCVCAPLLPDQGPVVNKIAMARTFWYAHVHEGAHFNSEQDDIALFKDSPVPHPYHRSSPSNALVHTPLENTYTYRMALAPIRVPPACREITASLTGPKALRHQVDEANEQ
ncbi:hypothetical protein BS47DRAFT_1399848 [Hydnum rufescens UP504]|uniref:Uncharacterized protein n=1 Tax=Hydnum rufescens UP504 TaxID=1448309 RepID=A0A9P6AHY5_9AGAM|nr:hypothetical protein BS47DRAFT_1399848 [Hydnum rufescens UP504]